MSNEITDETPHSSLTDAEQEGWSVAVAPTIVDPTSSDAVAMGRIWRAAGITGVRGERSPGGRYLYRPQDPPASVQGSKGRRHRASGSTTSFSTTAGIAIVVVVLALIAGGVAVGRYIIPSRSASASATAEERAQQLFNAALAEQKAGQLSSAERGYLAALKIDPLYYAAYYDLGVLYQATNRTSDATLAYEKTLIANPTFQPAIFNLAIIDSTSDPKSAIVLYKRLQQLHPQNPAAVAFNLGLVYREIGSVADGNAQLRYAVSIDPALAAKIPSQYLPIGQSASTSGTS